jgi:hypothetical protein
MHKATPGVHRSLRGIAEEKNEASGFDGPSDASYDAMGGTPKDAKDVSRGTYTCNVMGTLTQTPIPSKSIKNPIK